MKKWIFLLFFLPSLSTTAQTRQHIFLSVELHKTYGLSSAYSRVLRGTNFGVGADIIDIRSQRLGGIMPSPDLR